MPIRTREWYFSLIKITGFSITTLEDGGEFLIKDNDATTTQELTEKTSNEEIDEKNKYVNFLPKLSVSADPPTPPPKPPAKKPKKPSGGEPSGGGSTPKQTQKVLIAFGLLLDTQICEVLKLQQLELKNIRKNYKEIENASVIKIHTQTDAIRAGFFAQWLASFYKEPEEGGDIDLTSLTTLNFVTPGSFSYDTVETHLINLKTIKLTSGSFIYYNESLKRKRIRGANK